MKKAAALQAALSQGGRTPTEAGQGEAAKTTSGNAPSKKPPSREGKINVSAWLDPAYKRSLRMVQARTDKKIEPLMAEALNDLFQKYDVPQIRED